MAEETDKPNDASAANGTASGSDDMIDLEGLVRNIDLTPVDSIVVKKNPKDSAKDPAPGSTDSHAPAETGAVPAESPAPTSAASVAPVEDVDDEESKVEELDLAKLDEILNVEDPEMAAQIDAIRAAGFKKGEADPTIEDDEDAAKALDPHTKRSFRERLRFQFLKIGVAARAVKTFGVRAVKDSKGLLREILGAAKVGVVSKLHNAKAGIGAGFAWFKSRNLTQKLSLIASLLVVALLVFVGAKTLQGTLLPTVERAWIANFTEHADGKFTYDPTGTFEDFNDPLLHPEFVILVERIVVNLSRTPQAPESANPMAAFELYLQTDNQEAAVEIKDRNVEIRDAVARSVERMTYPDLADEDGKAKLKLLIRKDLNEIITRGKVRRVFFKTIVLNPES